MYIMWYFRRGELASIGGSETEASVDLLYRLVVFGGRNQAIVIET